MASRLQIHVTVYSRTGKFILPSIHEQDQSDHIEQLGNESLPMPWVIVSQQSAVAVLAETIRVD